MEADSECCCKDYYHNTQLEKSGSFKTHELNYSN